MTARSALKGCLMEQCQYIHWNVMSHRTCRRRSLLQLMLLAGRSMQEPAPSFQGEGAHSQPECKAASIEKKRRRQKVLLALHITIA